MNYSEIFAQLMIIIAVLVAMVNVITEVFKKVLEFKKEGTINWFVTILSVVLTVAVFLAYWQIKQMQITWYIFASFIFVGFMVAYSAMFGFDKLWKNFEKVKI